MFSDSCGDLNLLTLERSETNNDVCLLSIQFSNNSTQSQSFGCEPVRRMINALIYYSTLNVVHDERDQEQFIRFCTQTYPQLLNDYIHIMDAHRNDLDEIRQWMVRDWRLHSACNIYNCALLLRHFRDRDTEIVHAKVPQRWRCGVCTLINTPRSTQCQACFATKVCEFDVLFYVDILDAMHCQIYHLYDMALRVNVSDENGGRESDSEPDDAYYDAVFSKMSREISEKRNMVSRSISALEHISGLNKPKFTLHEYDLDGLFDALSARPELSYLAEFLRNEDYDSDAINQDLCGCTELASNIAQLVGQSGTSAHLEVINGYACNIKRDEKTFGIGYRFEYPSDENSLTSNLQSTSRIQVNELLVQPKHKSLKEEILSNTICALQLSQFNHSAQKVAKYSFTSKVKSMVRICTSYDGWSTTATEYPITLSHLLAVSLYCDYSVLCQHFSRSFRRQRWNEPLAAVKERHAQFAHMAILIRECVQFYGEINDGPFYCGVSSPMLMPEFCIHLNCPTSTSSAIEIAQRFCGDQGMILEMAEFGEYCYSFDTQWLSNFVEESEYLFCGDTQPLRVQTVIMQETSQNYKVFFKALFKLHANLTDLKGNDYAAMLPLNAKIDGVLSKRDNKILHALFECEMEQKQLFPAYVHDTFQAFLANMKEIYLDFNVDVAAEYDNMWTLDLWAMSTDTEERRDAEQCKVVRRMADLLFYTAEDEWCDRFVFDGVLCGKNVLKLKMMKVFPNLQEIIMDIDIGMFNKLTLLAFLSELRKSMQFLPPSLRFVIKGDDVDTLLDDEIYYVLDRYQWDIDLDESNEDSPQIIVQRTLNVTSLDA